MLINEREKLASILRTTADTLDIPDDVYEDATLKYEDIGAYLAAEDSDLREYDPQIYPQGSFRLGTVVQPLDGSSGYDIDLVCRLSIAKESVTQTELKDRVGRRLRKREDLAKILSPSRRCWVLDYPPESGTPRFHMDVLPTIPNVERPPTGILLTDTDLLHWQKSNPVAYAEWFKARMAVIFTEKKAALAETLMAAVEEVPDWQVKTPLQRSVQILKRHRDVYFRTREEVRPISIILTTLAAHAYRNEPDIFDALEGIAAAMPKYIEYRNGKWWVENPVDKDENFADRWNEYPERRLAFLKWLEKVKSDFKRVAAMDSVKSGLIELEESLGAETMEKVGSRLGVPLRQSLALRPAQALTVPGLADAQHAWKPSWPIVQTYTVKVNVTVHFRRGGRLLWPMADKPVRKKVWLRFATKTTAPKPYSIKWQVVNTGSEATTANQARGDFYESDEPEKGVRWETTAYRGTHWVEAFVIRDGVCVARSGKIVVKVR
ncbi:MAG: hypothetical protein QOH88_1529 [Verrucomicrobiota bacterium]|jgi:hypothetical protein